jgi:NADP-dependent 3-hydroxy acid dehydrogenase YdfG
MGFSFELTGRTALITGASSGLGTRFGRILAVSGAKVALGARRIDRLEDLADRIGANAARCQWTSRARPTSSPGSMPPKPRSARSIR